MDDLFSQRNQHSGTRMEPLRDRHRQPPHSLPRDGNTDILKQNFKKIYLDAGLLKITKEKKYV